MSKIIKISCLLSAAAFLFFACCKRNKPPEIPDKPTGPTIIRKNTIGEYITKTHDPNKDDEIRYIFDWGDGNLDTTRYFTNDSVADTTHAWVDTGKYMIKVRAQDNKNALSKDWSDTLGVAVVLNSAPNKPSTPTGFSSGSPNIKYTFNTNVVDADDDSVAVKFNWGNGRSPTWTNFYASGDTINDTITYSDTGNFSIRVLAKDVLNDTSEWSNAFQFRVTLANHPPNKPVTPIGPYIGLINVRYTFKTNVVDIDNDSVSVKFDWGNGRSSSWTNFYASNDTIQDTITYSDTGTFSIRVIAKDIHGDTSDWSNTFLFTVSSNLPPNVPEIVNLPESTYTLASVALLVSTIDPERNGIYYIIDWGDDIIDTFPREPEEEPFPSGETVFVFHTFAKWSPPHEPAFKYFSIKATAKDDRGNIQQNWSTPETIKVIYNEEPNRPEIFKKNERGAINTWQTFKATTNDPEEDSISIHFNFFRSGIWTPLRPSGDTLYGIANWLSPGIKKVWAIAKDKKGSQSISSETLDFEVIAEGYVKGVFHAIFVEEGEPETLGLQSSPAISNIGGIDKIFIGSEASYAYIVNTQDMNYEQRIQHYKEFADDFFEWGNTPAVDVANQKWYIANDQGEFYALSFSGSRLWRYPGFNANFTRWSFTDAAFSGNYVCVATKDTLYSLNATTGLKVWFYRPGGCHITTSPIIDADGDILIGDDSGYVRKINGSTGALIWKKYIGDSIPTCGAIGSDGTMYFCVNTVMEGFLYALDPDSGNIRWSYSVGKEVTTSIAIDNQEYIYFGDDRGRIHAVKDGISKSGFPIALQAGWVNATLSTPSFAADNHFYVMTEEQHVFCIEADGRIRWETPLPTSDIAQMQGGKREDKLIPSPVIGTDGDIYVACGSDYVGLYKLQGRITGTPMLNSPWPTFRHDRQRSGKVGVYPSR